MLNESMKDALKYWLIAEPKHTDKINELIVNKIEGKNEKIERIFRNHNIKKEIVNNLKKSKITKYNFTYIQ